MSDSLEDASVDTVLDHVGPGKLIRSDVFTWVIERIRDLQGQIGDGMQVDVPNFVGRTVEDARVILSGSSVPLRLGPILDVDGKSVDPNADSNSDRIVLMQTPGPAEKTTSNQQVRLLVAAASDEPEPEPEPVIEGFSPEPVRVREEVTIQGENFPSPWNATGGDSVTFDGTSGTVKVAESHAQALVVRVPEGISGVPDSGDETTDITVTVAVQGTSVSDTLQVQPPSGQEIPQIDEIVSADDGEIRVDSSIEIIGSNFSSTPSENTVIYGTIERAASGVTEEGIVAPVPSASDLGISGGGSFVNIKVEVGGVESDAQNVFIVIP